ncbi:hydrogenase maturation nickel metallochaperone HypA [Adlercreutzia sp. R25]|uniref:Hydrogenase maturation nickel metallochaperone HypA n=1 Tax=Adlercreutzia shanghongiae TaxID=3111773 RepID=A0ABU6IWL9_9ACTN|nr:MULTISPECIES: hydrogenase maturation nickel metallochaperone HypA [unclassified Adlercreutzia]MEC4273644.1 hydrogenase maturation nickel metallochaperone HypA [Adlercreutzia sp. R25]MEC4294076.1 hydrogenase maturation nickel metallochaperone HypA [Adlercreutzia sp. R22]
MAVVTSILDAVCERAREEGAARVVSIDLRIGEMRDIHASLLQKYFDFFARGTLAEGVEVTMEMVPLRFRCDVCGRRYDYDFDEGAPTCDEHPGASVTVVSGTELVIEKIGVM